MKGNPNSKEGSGMLDWEKETIWILGFTEIGCLVTTEVKTRISNLQMGRKAGFEFIDFDLLNLLGIDPRSIPNIAGWITRENKCRPEQVIKKKDSQYSKIHIYIIFELGGGMPAGDIVYLTKYLIEAIAENCQVSVNLLTFFGAFENQVPSEFVKTTSEINAFAANQELFNQIIYLDFGAQQINHLDECVRIVSEAVWTIFGNYFGLEAYLELDDFEILRPWKGWQKIADYQVPEIPESGYPGKFGIIPNFADLKGWKNMAKGYLSGGYDKFELALWLIERYDELRSSTASRASIVLSAAAILITGSSFLFEKFLVLIPQISLIERVVLIFVFLLSLTFQLASIGSSASAIVNVWKKSRKMIGGEIPPRLLFNARDTIETYETLEKFEQEFKSTDEEQILSFALGELWTITNSHHKRYQILRRATRLLLISIVPLLVFMLAIFLLG